jgi:hypothetical protein
LTNVKQENLEPRPETSRPQKPPKTPHLTKLATERLNRAFHSVDNNHAMSSERRHIALASEFYMINIL